MNSTTPEHITFDGFNTPAISHGFFGRRGGISTGVYRSLNCGQGSGDDPQLVSKNRIRVAKTIKIEPQFLLSLYQKHSNQVVVVDTAWTEEERPPADGMITSRPGIGLGILTADCAPVLFHDAHIGMIGAAHAGWRGAVTGVLEQTVQTMLNHGADLARIQAAIGPSISQANYEVGDDFYSAVMRIHADGDPFFTPADQDAKRQFDLLAFIQHRLALMNLDAVHSTNICTYDSHSYFSYRRSQFEREPDYGRNISVIAMPHNQG